ncbi:MAG: EAL domain-containing protein [Candidatus Nanopelagicales bacterium]|nr:EAL domain-containing protein [Candidatus Nanopelagicales bacterium]
MATGEPVGMEALIRWQDPHRGPQEPGVFIPAAEETGLIVPMGYWVLDTALTQMQAWRQEIPGAKDFFVAVNISARQLLARGLVERVEQSLRTSGIPASAVQLEITESAVMNDLEPIVDTLVALRALGLSLAVDDFGTGYSSLAYLKRLPVTTVKIDRSFVSGLGAHDDAFDRPIVDAIIKMAQSLRLEVIAEGVEDTSQRQALMQLGAGVAQGYLWSRPLPADQLSDWLTVRQPTH